jgi:hypothetical protein
MNKKAIILAGLFAILLCSTACAAGETWLDFLDEHNREVLLADNSAVTAFFGTEMGVPMLVNQELGAQSYFLIPFNKQGGTTGVVMIDAEEGFFEQVTWTDEPAKYLPFSEEEAIAKARALISQPIAGQGIAVEFTYDFGATLEWQAGPYSQNPFNPYWRITAEGGEWILNQNGTIYTIKAIGPAKAQTVIEPMESVSESTSGFLVAGKFFEISNPALANGSFEARLTFNYDDAEQDGVVDGTGIEEAELNVYYYDNASAKWILVPGPSIDATANTIAVTVNHFTTFMLADEEQPASQTPAPVVQNTGGTGLPMGTGGSGSSAKIGMEIDGNCVGGETIAIVLNPSGNPVEGATVTIYTTAWKTVEAKKTGKDGTAVFGLEAGEYNARAEKTGYAVNTRAITIADCTVEQAQVTEAQEGVQAAGRGEEATTGTGEESIVQGQPLEAQGAQVQESGAIGFFSIETNREKATTAVMAGAFAAIIAGAILYIREKIRANKVSSE